MSDRLPRRYRFSNHDVVRREPPPLPESRQVFSSEHLPQPPQIVHIHQAPPDRTVQRLALGAGIGGGALVAAVFVGPMLVVLVQSLVLGIISLTVALAVAGWVVHTLVAAISGTRKGGRR